MISNCLVSDKPRRFIAYLKPKASPWVLIIRPTFPVMQIPEKISCPLHFSACGTCFVLMCVCTRAHTCVRVRVRVCVCVDVLFSFSSKGPKGFVFCSLPSVAGRCPTSRYPLLQPHKDHWRNLCTPCLACSHPW